LILAQFDFFDLLFAKPVEAVIAQAPVPVTLLVYPLFLISSLATRFLRPRMAGGKIFIMRMMARKAW
jgi:hypothetical protein